MCGKRDPSLSFGGVLQTRTKKAHRTYTGMKSLKPLANDRLPSLMAAMSVRHLHHDERCGIRGQLLGLVFEEPLGTLVRKGQPYTDVAMWLIGTVNSLYHAYTRSIWFPMVAKFDGPRRIEIHQQKSQLS